MYDPNSSPWAKSQQRKDRQEKLRYFLIALASVSVLLTIDLFYVSPSESSLFGTSFLAPLTLICIAFTGIVAYMYVQEDFEVYKLTRDDLPADSRKRYLEKSKETLRKAGIASSKSKVTSFSHDFPSMATPLHQSYTAQVKPSTSPQLNLNLRAFDSVDDLAESFLANKGLDKKIRTWMQNIRLWYSKDFLRLVLESHLENLLALNKQLREFTQGKDRYWIFEGSFDESRGLDLTFEERNYYKRVGLREIQDLAIEMGCNYVKDLEASRVYSIKGQQDPNVEKAIKRLVFVDTLRQRIMLEKYFEIPGYNCRGYVINRLHSLESSPGLSGYSANSGGSYQGDSWTAKRPTDAHILSHAFFRMLNNANNPTADPEFNMMNDIIINYPSTPPRYEQPQKVIFYQKNPDSIIEPHFEVISGSEIWSTYRGNENLFCAIALFFLHVKSKSQGYFYQMDCHEFFNLIS
ncbi:unnamed protein product [Blepharisma stoltei]|uniref:Uncharacterized protein n=1 Tax=Blepharisma stoltei TaxID=1481888 RepID=A0AAU9IMV5_9CILI|nr:unnamed protein product [Blepharisma stoltei]